MCTLHTRTMHLVTTLYSTITSRTNIHCIKLRGRLRIFREQRTNNTLFYIQFICTSSTMKKSPDRQLGFCAGCYILRKRVYRVHFSETPDEARHARRHRRCSAVQRAKNYLRLASPHQPIFPFIIIIFFLVRLQWTCCAALSQNI